MGSKQRAYDAEFREGAVRIGSRLASRSLVLADRGITGNGHAVMFEKNNAKILDVVIGGGPWSTPVAEDPATTTAPAARSQRGPGPSSGR